MWSEIRPGFVNDILNINSRISVENVKIYSVFVSDLNVIMSRSRDWNELQHTWIEWRRRTGQKVRDLFEQLVDMTNQAALLNSMYRVEIFGTVLV